MLASSEKSTVSWDVLRLPWSHGGIFSYNMITSSNSVGGGGLAMGIIKGMEEVGGQRLQNMLETCPGLWVGGHKADLPGN